MSNEIEILDTLLDAATDAQQEAVVLASLIRKGWLREDGRVAQDLDGFLHEASKLAFEEVQETA